MEKQKIDASKKILDVKQKASKVLSKTKDTFTKIADQNGDGKFDKEDVSKVANAIKENVDEKSRQIEIKRLQPVFASDIDDGDFLIQKFVRVTDRDKKYVESEVCKGSVAYFSNIKGVRLLNIFRDTIDNFGLSFFPDDRSEFYYVDPSDRDRYIALDDYFNYLKAERISELQRIAQDLGAKHFCVTYLEEKSSYSNNNVKGNVSVKKTSSLDVTRKKDENKYSKIEIAAENDFPGKSPMKPNLKYLLRDPSVQNLITMRLDDESALTHQKLMIKLSNTSGLKEIDGAKIDTVLRGMKISGNTTVQFEAKNESRRYLEYEIDF